LDYQLYAVCLHSGTAHGGHYHAFVSDGETWYDANDSRVTRLDEQRRLNLFAKREDGSTTELRSTDAYYLFYRRCGGTQEIQARVSEQELPATLLEEFRQENKQVADLQRAYKFHQEMRSLCVYGPPAVYATLLGFADSALRDLSECRSAVEPPASITVQVNRRRGLHAILRQARDAVVAAANKGEEIWAWAKDLDQASSGSWTLRKFDAALGRPGALVSEASAEHLFGAHVSAGAAAVLLEPCGGGAGEDGVAAGEEVAAAGAACIVCRWDASRCRISLDRGNLRVLHLQSPDPPDLFGAEAGDSGKVSSAGPVSSPLLAALRAAAAAAFGLSGVARVALVALTGTRAGRALVDDHLTLSACGVNDRDIICVEELTDDRGVDCLASVRLYDEKRNTAKLSFNHPDRPQFTEEFGPVSISKDATVADLKAMLAGILELDLAKLHLCRHQTSPQFKEESATLRQVGLGELCSVFAGHGRPLAPNEIVVRFSLYKKDSKDSEGPKAKLDISIPASTSSSVRSLRQALEEPLVLWATDVGAKSGGVPPFPLEGLTWKRLRLRDGAAGKGFAILRDESKIKGPAFGDGRQVAVQVLDADEELKADDIILGIRPWRVCDGILHAATDVIIGRSKTLGDLLDVLNTRFKGMLETDEDVLEVVTLPSVGPPLSVKRCLTLKWSESRLTNPDAESLAKPLSEYKELRDGVVLVVRSGAAATRGAPAETAGEGKGTGKGPGKGPTAGPAQGGDLASQIAAKAAALAAGPTAKAAAKASARAERGLVIRVERPEGPKTSELVPAPREDTAARAGGVPEAPPPPVGSEASEEEDDAPKTPSSLPSMPVTPSVPSPRSSDGGHLAEGP